MSTSDELIEKLTTLNRIGDSLNQAVDVQGVLNSALADLVEAMGLETGWIFLADRQAQDMRWGPGYRLAAHHNLPPALSLDNEKVWNKSCICQQQCNESALVKACNEVHCRRILDAQGDRRGLALHASTPLRGRNQILGILNVAAADWASFSPEALALLTNVGSQIGTALERAMLYDLLQEKHQHEHAVLLNLSNQLLSRPELEDLIDYLVREVRLILGVDACALLLPSDDGERLEYRDSSGWKADPVAAGRGMSLDGPTGLSLAMRSQQPFLEKDLSKHPSHLSLPAWLRAEGFRGHAVVPLLAEGRSVGALVIDSRQPHLPSPEELRLLRLLGNQAAMAIENARLHLRELAAEGLERELSLGREIQLGLLPGKVPQISGWEFATFYEPAWEVGGDFYECQPVPGQDDEMDLVVADVAGKGVPAALFMALSQTILRGTTHNGRDLASALRQANDLILNDNRAELFLTAFYARLNTRSGHLKYVNAGHNPPLWQQATSAELTPLPGHGTVLGAFDETYLEEYEIQMAPGDSLILYTDGVTEAMNANGQQFENGRLEAVVAANAGADAQALRDAIVQAVQDFRGETPPSDDLTLCVVRRLP